MSVIRQITVLSQWYRSNSRWQVKDERLGRPYCVVCSKRKWLLGGGDTSTIITSLTESDSSWRAHLAMTSAVTHAVTSPCYVYDRQLYDGARRATRCVVVEVLRYSDGYMVRVYTVDLFFLLQRAVRKTKNEWRHCRFSFCRSTAFTLQTNASNL